MRDIVPIEEQIEERPMAAPSNRITYIKPVFSSSLPKYEPDTDMERVEVDMDEGLSE
jgi:hypothetical protein